MKTKIHAIIIFIFIFEFEAYSSLYRDVVIFDSTKHYKYSELMKKQRSKATTTKTNLTA